MKSPLSLFFDVVKSLMTSLLDYVIVLLSRLLWHLGYFRRFSVDLLTNFENFISVIIINFILYDFSVVIFVGFVGAIILSLFKVLFETYLDSSVHNSLFEIDAYNLVRADHPNDTKRGGVCIDYKESLSVRVINLSYFEEALLLEMNYQNKKVIVSVIYPLLS